MHILSADDITQAEHYTKQTLVKRWLILMLYSIGKSDISEFLRTVPQSQWFSLLWQLASYHHLCCGDAN